MNTLADLHRAVQTTLTSKRLGQPVFVRYLWSSPDKPETVLPRLAHVAATIRDWLGQTPERVYALGGAAAGQVSLTLEFREGASALLCWSVGKGVDLMVLGTKGAIYHETGAADSWDEPATFPEARPDAELQSAIERALRTGRPEPAGKDVP